MEGKYMELFLSGRSNVVKHLTLKLNDEHSIVQVCQLLRGANISEASTFRWRRCPVPEALPNVPKNLEVAAI
jgi:hypothetical protein